MWKSHLLSKIERGLQGLLMRSVHMECDHIPIQFQNVPIKKIINWILVESSVFFRPVKPWGLPTHLMIEPTNMCNMKCTLCPVTHGLNRPKGHMHIDLLKKILDEIGEYLFLLLLWDWGEPFLNPHIYSMIALAKGYGIKVVSSSNGQVFWEEVHAEKLVQSGIDVLIVAVDGMTQSTYERYRKGGNLKKVIQGIRNIVQARKSGDSSTPLINLRFIAMKHNEHEIPELKDFASQCGADVLTVRTLYTYDDQNSCRTQIDGRPFLPDNPRYRRFERNSITDDRIRHKKNPCKALWNNAVIHWNGKICPCTFDPYEQHVLGDLSEQSFKEIWCAGEYAKLRRQFRKSDESVSLCSQCSNAFQGGTCGIEDIVDIYFIEKNKIDPSLNC